MRGASCRRPGGTSVAERSFDKFAASRRQRREPEPTDYLKLAYVGAAGSTADAFSLLTRFETKLEQFQGQLERAAIELSKDWRTDKYLRNLEALLIVADNTDAFLISGKGDVISSDDGLLAVGSGSMYALSAARALMKHTKLTAKEIAEEALRIAAEICIYTNSDIVVEEI